MDASNAARAAIQAPLLELCRGKLQALVLRGVEESSCGEPFVRADSLSILSKFVLFRKPVPFSDSPVNTTWFQPWILRWECISGTHNMEPRNVGSAPRRVTHPEAFAISRETTRRAMAKDLRNLSGPWPANPKSSSAVFRQRHTWE